MMTHPSLGVFLRWPSSNCSHLQFSPCQNSFPSHGSSRTLIPRRNLVPFFTFLFQRAFLVLCLILSFISLRFSVPSILLSLPSPLPEASSLSSTFLSLLIHLLCCRFTRKQLCGNLRLEIELLVATECKFFLHPGLEVIAWSRVSVSRK